MHSEIRYSLKDFEYKFHFGLGLYKQSILNFMQFYRVFGFFVEAET